MDTKAPTPAEQEFNTSSVYTVPSGYKPWQIRNDYPKPHSPSVKPGPIYGFPGQLPPGEDPTPWLDVDFKKHPNEYMELIKEYFYEGMIQNDFIAQDNKVRAWYHAPWMHYGANGREPIRGLTPERPTPVGELSKSQDRVLQTWACGFFNTPASTLLGKVWENQNDPDVAGNLLFPEKSLIVKTIFTTATDEEVPSMKGAPEWQAVLCSDPNNPGTTRQDFATPVRLLQIDVAAVDKRAPLGWVFGTFMYDGRAFDYYKSGVKDPQVQWNRVISVGLQWGNDPELTEKEYLAGRRPQESWINPVANELLKSLAGKRPFWGWNGRMNGPADNFISACMSCHSVAQVKVPGKAPSIVPPTPVEGPAGSWRPRDDAVTMKWFSNVPCGTPFTEKAISTDYNLQIQIGVQNFYQWQNTQKKESKSEPDPTHHEILMAGPEMTGPIRAGPPIKYM